jgi:outer membrane protein TolC
MLKYNGDGFVQNGIGVLSRGVAACLACLMVAGSLAAQSVARPSYSLEDAIALALENNRDLQDARLGLETAGQQVREAWGSLFPTVDASLSVQRNLQVQEVFLPRIIFDPNASPDELVPVRFGADNNWSAWLNISQPLFDAGALVGVGTAGRFRGLQREIVRGQAQAITSRVRRAYYQALLAHEQVRVTEESVRRMETTLQETEGLQRAGLASSYDVLRLEVRLANLKPNLRRAANAALAAERDLAVELGTDDMTAVRVAGRLYEVDLASPDANEGPNRDLLRLVGYRNALEAPYESVYELARRMRSDIRQARLNRQLENARVRFERTSLFPRLSAFFAYGIIAQEDGALDPFGEDANQRTTSAYVGVQLEIPIFSGFQRLARVQQRKLAQRQAEVRLDLLEQQAANQIRTALEALEEARLRAEAQGQAIGEAQRGFEIVTSQYLAGISSQLEVTEGEVLLRESEFNYAQAIYDYLVAQADLDDAVGVVPVIDVPPAVEAELSISE